MSLYTPKVDNKCYITTNSPDGKVTTFLDSTSFLTRPTHPGLAVSYAYSADSTPSLTDDTDLKAHQEIIKQGKASSLPSAGRSSAAILHIEANPNGTEGFMHRTRTLDYVYVREGEAEYSVNSGEKKILKKGDVIIQRAGWHAWKNTSKTEELSLFAVAIGGEGATEDYMEFSSA